MNVLIIDFDQTFGQNCDRVWGTRYNLLFYVFNSFIRAWKDSTFRSELTDFEAPG